jgi:uncharacterized membrane protein YoaK (UPF0700 family)
MDKQQAELVAETLMTPHVERLDMAQAQRVRRQKGLKTQRRRGAWSLAGFLAGAAVGLLATGSIWPPALAGLVLGAIVGIALTKRA